MISSTRSKYNKVDFTASDYKATVQLKIEARQKCLVDQLLLCRNLLLLPVVETAFLLILNIFESLTNNRMGGMRLALEAFKAGSKVWG